MNVGIRCDAGPRIGVGHLVRCVALAEELVSRGVRVTFLGDLGGLPWALDQLTSRNLPHEPAPADPVGAARRLSLDAVVIDSYVLPPSHSRALLDAGIPVLAIVDGDFRGQSATLYVDQNLDAAFPAGVTGLAGIDYALLRTAVRSRRPTLAPGAAGARTIPSVVAFFGGTDAFGAAPRIAELLIRTAMPFDATIIGANPELRAALTALAVGDGQTLTVIPPTDELPALLADADLVVSASGTSTWELLCLGCASALVWVVDNQIIGYERTVARGYAAGIGSLSALDDKSVAVLRDLLSSPAARAELAQRGWKAVDGRGPERVADALLRL